MSFIEKISNYSAKWLATKVPNDKYPSVEDQTEVYGYGFMVIWGAVFKLVLMVSLASIFGIFAPAMFIMLTFSSLRIIAGGYHFESYNKCAIVSLIQFIGTALIVQHIYQYWSQANIYILFIFCITSSLYIIFRYVPRDTPNKSITEPSERMKFKRWSLYYILIWATIMTIFMLLDIKIIIISSCFGLLLELFSISKVGYDIYSILDQHSQTSPIQIK